MNRIRLFACGLLMAASVVVPIFAHGQQIGSPSGLAAERSLPSRHEHVVQDMLKFCQPAKGFWVDLGAGQGQVAIPLIEKTGNPVVMVDPNAEAMSIGLQTAREKGLQDRLSAVVGVAEALPLPDNSVDLVVSRGSIFFWEDPVKGLQEVYRVLRPGCRAYIGGGAGSGYPPEAVAALIEGRKKRLEGDEAEKWKRFVELRRPEQMRRWAEDAGLPEFQVLGRGAISADDPRVGQGVWLLFEKQPEISTQKEDDSVSVTRQGDTVIYSVHSASGIGGATLRGCEKMGLAPSENRENLGKSVVATVPVPIFSQPLRSWNRWPGKVVLRLHLRGLESLTVSNGQVELRASVLSHSGNPTRLSIRRDEEELPVEQADAAWTKIGVFDADGKEIAGLPEEGGYFEIPLPAVLLEGQPRSLTVQWIDFYRL